LNADWFSKPTPYELDQTTIAMVASPEYRWAEGLKVTEAAEQAGRAPGDFVCEILLASGMAVGIVGFRPGERTEDDVRAILRHPAHMAGSDGIYCGSFPHPRGWGAFARYLGYHTRTLGDYSWAEAVTHLSTHAARRFRLTDRGLLRPGFAADVAVFDPATITDHSTYANGRALAEGIRHVVVNGVLALEDGQPTGATPGRALRRG
jgi:N-acyl-D-amino-acid deacylase